MSGILSFWHLLQGSLCFLLPNLPGSFFLTCTEIRSNKMVLAAIPGFNHTSPPMDMHAVLPLRNGVCGWAGGWWGTRGLYTDLYKWKITSALVSNHKMICRYDNLQHHSPVHMPLTHSYLYLVQAIYTEGDIVLLCMYIHRDLHMRYIEKRQSVKYSNWKSFRWTKTLHEVSVCSAIRWWPSPPLTIILHCLGQVSQAANVSMLLQGEPNLTTAWHTPRGLTWWRGLA